MSLDWNPRGVDPHLKPAKLRDYSYWLLALPLGIIGLLILCSC